MRLYDGRPSSEALQARLKRDRIEGEARPLVCRQESIHRLDHYYEVITIGIFDDADNLLAHYQTRRDGKITGCVKDAPSWGWMGPRNFRPATRADFDALSPKEP